MMNPDATVVELVAEARCILLTTFKRDHTGVSTPVWFNVMDGRILITTEVGSGKVKRLSNNPRVEFATCTQWGRVTGLVYGGTARVLPPEQLGSVMAAKKRRYFTARLIAMLPNKRDQVAIEIVADAVGGVSGS
jgi:PPOX class probable F420-dependent enzyme